MKKLGLAILLALSLNLSAWADPNQDLLEASQAGQLPKVQQALKRDPKLELAQMNLAHAYLFTDQYAQAARIYASLLGPLDSLMYHDHKIGLVFELNTLKDYGLPGNVLDVVINKLNMLEKLD